MANHRALHPRARPVSPRLISVFAATALLLTGPMAHACYSGLVGIPTTDMVAEGWCGIEPQMDGVFGHRTDDLRILHFQVGLGPRLEAGVDLDLSEGASSRLLLNAKYLLTHGSESRPAVAGGICNVGSGLKALPYLVASQQFGGIRGHAGVASIEGALRWFVGADHALNDRWTLMADYTNGDENGASVGASYQFTDRLGITAGVLVPNSSEEKASFSVHLVFSGPLWGAREED